MTFSELYEAWKAEKAGTLKRSSLSTYVLLAENHLLPLIGEREDLGEKDMLSLRKALQEKLDSKTAYDAARIAMTVLRYGGAQGLCPMPNWTLKQDPEIRQRIGRSDFNILTPKEQAALIDFFGKDRIPRNIALYLALTTGVTVGELCCIRWQDIDYKAKVLHIRSIIENYYSIDADTQERTWSKDAGENGALRDIPLSDRQMAFLAPEEGTHSPELFVINNGPRPWDPRYARSYLKKVFGLLDIKGHQFKDLRHSFAVRCLQSGCDYGTLSRLMGIERIDWLVKNYRPYVPENPRRCMERMMDTIPEYQIL